MELQRQLRPTMTPGARTARGPRPSGADRIVVIGAGVGGLACAAELASRGHDVVVVERAAGIGGKLREVEVGGCRLDAGPTVFTMRWVFDELFADLGSRLDDHLSLRPADALARHAWSADERLDLFADLDRSAEAIAAFAGVAEGERYRAFCVRAENIYRTLEAPFLRASRPTPVSLATRVGWRGLPSLLRISPFATLWSSLGEHFRDPRLQQLFGRYATYCGSSPYLAPATLMLVAHVEREGVWRVEGGMHRIALALAGLLEGAGGRVRLGSGVREIVVEGGRAAGVVLDDGETLHADAVVFNGDVAALAAGLLGGDRVAAAADAFAPALRSQSALTWNVVAPTRGFPLLRHNVFFGHDYRDEFAAVFDRGELPADPTVYVCAQDREGDADVAPGAAERLLCLVNAPARGDQAPLSAKEISTCERRMTNVLARCGLSIEATPADTLRTTPSDFARMFPGSAGALYGRASHGWAASFSRPGARSRLPGLYLAGGTVHPGPGLPMAVLSGRQAAASVQADRRSGRASISTSPPRATPGGMSMP